MLSAVAAYALIQLGLNSINFKNIFILMAFWPLQENTRIALANNFLSTVGRLLMMAIIGRNMQKLYTIIKKDITFDGI